VGLLWDKSSRGSKFTKVFGGVIDPGYTGEVLVSLMNFGSEIVDISPVDKLCQMILQPHLDSLEFGDWTDKLEETVRGTKGFGSSGGV
jgi:dUTP pyrophosphatase